MSKLSILTAMALAASQGSYSTYPTWSDRGTPPAKSGAAIRRAKYKAEKLARKKNRPKK